MLFAHAFSKYHTVIEKVHSRISSPKSDAWMHLNISISYRLLFIVYVQKLMRTVTDDVFVQLRNKRVFF